MKSNQLPSQILTAIEGKNKYPIGTLAYFGPDDQTCSKITASVINAPNAKPEFRHWIEEGVCTDPAVIAEIGEYFRLHKVQEVIMTEGIIGCPHDEGVDFPEGENCPHCPFWHGQE